jgi:hypothetical protein
MLLLVVGVNAVGHVSADDKTTMQCFMQRVGFSLALTEKSVNAFESQAQEGRVSSLSALRSDFFVVKEGHNVDELASLPGCSIRENGF